MHDDRGTRSGGWAQGEGEEVQGLQGREEVQGLQGDRGATKPLACVEQDAGGRSEEVCVRAREREESTVCRRHTEAYGGIRRHTEAYA